MIKQTKYIAMAKQKQIKYIAMAKQKQTNKIYINGYMHITIALDDILKEVC